MSSTLTEHHDLAVSKSPPQGFRSKFRLRLMSCIITAAIDALAIFLAYVIASFLWLGRLNYELGLVLAGVNIFFYLIVSTFNGGNGPSAIVKPLTSWFHAIVAFFVTSSLILFAAFFIKASDQLSRGVFTLAFFLSPFAITAGRAIVRAINRRFFASGLLSVIVIKDGQKIDPDLGSTVIDARANGLVPAINDPAMMDRIGKTIDGADRVIIACPESERKHWALALRGAPMQIEVLAPRLIDLGAVTGTEYAGIPTLRISSGWLDFSDRILKRALDLSIVIALVPVVVPILVVIAIAIKLDSAGPVLFVQPRIGRGSKSFQMFKFRSMRVEASDIEGDRSTSRSDDRVTKVGAILRSTSLDELPQLFNVLLGDMSIVGPRPHAKSSRAEEALFWELDHRYWHRHAVKPGMTGLAQVRGFRGATHKRSDLLQRLAADLEYVRDWSIWKDLQIILATFRVLVHRNAY